MFRYALAACAALVVGCATNSDGSVSLGVVGSPFWHEKAPQKDVHAYYDAMQVHELCILWAEKYDRRDVRKAISESLIRRNMNPLRCY